MLLRSSGTCSNGKMSGCLSGTCGPSKAEAVGDGNPARDTRSEGFAIEYARLPQEVRPWGLATLSSVVLPGRLEGKGDGSRGECRGFGYS